MPTAQPGDILLLIRPDEQPPYEIVADMRDLRLWEKTSPRHTLRKIIENPSSEDFYTLAHIAIRRQRGTEAVPPLQEFMDTTVVIPRPDAATAAGINHHELTDVIDKALVFEEATAATIADRVMDFLESVRDRAVEVNPTHPGR
jgi:hypothetical protein